MAYNKQQNNLLPIKKGKRKARQGKRNLSARADDCTKEHVGLAFVITNYLKGFFSALFPDFSIDVR